MEKKIDGWKIICGHDVYIENGKVVRGVAGGCTVFPYRWDEKLNCWAKADSLSVAAFRAACSRNSIKLI